MKITIVNSFLPPWRGGAETYTYNLAKGLAVRGHEVTVHCGSDPLQPGTSRESKVKIARHRILSRLYGTPIMPGIMRALRFADADILHGNFPSPYIACMVALASKRRVIPAVLTWHNDLPPVTSGARALIEVHDKLVLPRYVRFYRKVISTSAYYAQRSRIISQLGSRVQVIPNGVDCDRFNPTVDGSKVRESVRLGNRFTVIFVGALTKWHRYKGLDILLQAMNNKELREEKVALIVVGDGELRPQYLAMTRDIALDDMVSFVGNIDDERLPEYYAASDLLVLPSKDISEGFGLTLLEANASGKPVIASRVGGIPSVVRERYNGVLVPPNDPQSLAKAIVEFVRNPSQARRMGGNGRKHAEIHDWKITITNTERVYEEILS